MADSAESADEFGFSLASGDFDDGGRDDLGVGVPTDSVEGGAANAGSVHAIYGGAGGLTASGDQVFHQNASGMADTAVALDFFDQSVSASDFDADGRDDLGVGIPGKVVSGVVRAGAIHAIYGSSAGLSVSADQVFHQDTSGMADTAELEDRFGGGLPGSPFSQLLVG